MSNVKQMKCARPHEHSQLAPRRRRPQLPKIPIGGLLGQIRGTVERLRRHGHVQAEQLRLLMPVEIHREFVSPTENPSKENAAPMATTPTEGTSWSRRKCPQRPLACTCLHTRTLQSCCGIAAKELTAPMSRSQATRSGTALPAAPMCSSGTSSTIQGKSLQLRAQYTLGWSTCSRSCGPFAVVTSTRNTRQVALRTTLGLLMQSIEKRSARPLD